MPKLPYMILIFAAGLCWPLQAAINSQVKVKTAQPLAAVFVNGGGAAILAGIIMLVLGVWAGRIQTPTASAIQSIPWWGYLGGIISVLVIIAQSSGAVPLGAALLVTLFVTGQALSSAAFDHLGLLGFDQKAVSPTRAIGLVVVVVGAILISIGTPSTKAATPTLEPTEGNGSGSKEVHS